MTRYYTLDSTTNDLAPLALPIAVDGRLVLHPSPAQAAALGAHPRNDDAPAPTPPEGKVAIPDSWEVRDGKWVRTWRYEDAPPPPPRTFSILRIEAALLSAGLLSRLDAFIDAQTYTDPSSGNSMPLRRAYDRANDLRDDHPLFGMYYSAAKEALGLTDEQAEAILASAEE